MHDNPTKSANLVWRTIEVPLVATRNLVLVNRPGSQDVADFIRIRELIGERAPDIETFIARWDHPGSVTRRQAARRPSLVFSPTPLSSFLPMSGKIYCGRNISKLEQARRLQSAGIATPETVPYGSDTELDLSKWGELTVLKPDTGGGGKGIEVIRTKSLGKARLQGKEGEFGRRMIAQPYIDTGPYPAKYRLLAIFGRPLYCELQASVAKAPPVDPESSVPIEGLITSQASSPATAGTRRTTVSNEPDVLAFAPIAAAAFSEIPLLGLDIIREAATGKLYVLEVNPLGYTWHLSSKLGKIAQRRLQIDRYSQFDALSVAADSLIERTRAEAQ
jgi:hypothetical protein